MFLNKRKRRHRNLSIGQPSCGLVKCANLLKFFADQSSLDFQQLFGDALKTDPSVWQQGQYPASNTLQNLTQQLGQNMLPQGIGQETKGWVSGSLEGFGQGQYGQHNQQPPVPRRQAPKTPSAGRVKPSGRSEGTYTHQCEICHKLFSGHSGLYFHMATHTGNYKYKCIMCDRGFMQNTKYQAHLKTHRKVLEQYQK